MREGSSEKETDGGSRKEDIAKDNVQTLDSRDKSKAGSSRGKKMVTEKAEDVATAPLTRNSIREKGVTLEETPVIAVKKLTNKDISATPPSTIILRRSITRAAGATDEEKSEIKSSSDVPLSPNKVYAASARKSTTPKVPEAHTPNLRSRRGHTPTRMAKTPVEKLAKTSTTKDSSVKKESDSKDKLDSEPSIPLKDTTMTDSDRMTPRKTSSDKDKAKEVLVVKSEDESNGEISDAPTDEFNKGMSGVDDESCDNEEVSKKKRFKPLPRKERSESGEMADDDNSVLKNN